MVNVRKFLVLLGTLFMCALGAQAQFIGYTSGQTITSTPFNATACTGSQQTATVPNIGQLAHYLIFQGNTVASLQVKIQGSNNGSTFFDISETATGGGNQTGELTGSGYFAVVQIAVTCTSGGTFTAFYTGQSATPGQLFGNALTSQLVKTIAFQVTAGSNFTQALTRAPFGSAGGALFFKFGSAGPANSTLTVLCSADETSLSQITTSVFSLATGTTVQTFQVPPQACSYFQATYTSGGASAAVWSAFYSFSEPGAAPPAQQYTHVTTTTATAAKATAGFLHTVTINTSAAGTLSIFDLATASCTGTPATNTVAVITAAASPAPLTFTYDVNLLNGICLKASVAMDYTVSSQ